MLQCCNAAMLQCCNAAFSLAMKNNKYNLFAEKIISVKNENACRVLINTRSSLTKDLTKEVLTMNRILKFENLLNNISKTKPQAYQNSDILNYSSHLPRLAVKKTDENYHGYFLPYNNQRKVITITAA